MIVRCGGDGLTGLDFLDAFTWGVKGQSGALSTPGCNMAGFQSLGVRRSPPLRQSSGLAHSTGLRAGTFGGA